MKKGEGERRCGVIGEGRERMESVRSKMRTRTKIRESTRYRKRKTTLRRTTISRRG